jgi:hypothetical protein
MLERSEFELGEIELVRETIHCFRANGLRSHRAARLAVADPVLVEPLLDPLVSGRLVSGRMERGGRAVSTVCRSGGSSRRERRRQRREDDDIGVDLLKKSGNGGPLA